MHPIPAPRPRRRTFRHSGLAALAAALLAAASAVPARAQDAAAPDTVTLRGSVVDASDGQPVPHARIEVVNTGQRAAADRRGQFALRLPPGSHLVRFREVGYEDLREMWTATVDDAGLVVELTPDPLVLEGVRVQAQRLEARLERLTVQARAFDSDAIHDFGGGSTLDFLSMHAGLTPIACDPRHSVRPQCAWVRGGVNPVAVVIDEIHSRGGLEDLQLMPVQEIHRIEVIGGGAQVRVYTRYFVERLARSGGPLLPIPRNLGRAPRARSYTP